MAADKPLRLADLASCRSGDYLCTRANLAPGTPRPTEADPAIVARLAARGLRPAFDDVGMAVLHTDEIDALIVALTHRAGELAAQLHAQDGGDPESCRREATYMAFRAYLRLERLSVEELRRRAALVGLVDCARGSSHPTPGSSSGIKRAVAG